MQLKGTNVKQRLTPNVQHQNVVCDGWGAEKGCYDTRVSWGIESAFLTFSLILCAPFCLREAANNGKAKPFYNGENCCRDARWRLKQLQGNLIGNIGAVVHCISTGIHNLECKVNRLIAGHLVFARHFATQIFGGAEAAGGH